jgi:hypothetical protein
MSREHSQQRSLHYSESQSLRAIAQDLEARHVKAFDLERQNDDYFVWVRTQTLPEEPPLKVERAVPWTSRLRFWHHPVTQEGNFRASATQLRYSPEDVDRLEDQGQARRRDPNGMPDARSLSQLLRAIGGHVSRSAVELLAISWREESVSVVYKTSQGRREMDAFRLDSIYDLWVNMYLRRSK